MIVVIIPAKASSKRLKNKNMRLVNGKPLIQYTINYAKESNLIDDVYISTDSKKIINFSKKIKIKTIKRSKKLSGETPIIEVYRHALKKINKKKIKIIVGLQVDHPDRNLILDRLIKKFIIKKLDFLFSVDKNNIKNGAHYILSRRYLLSGIMKKKFKVVDDCTNIHYLKDLKKAEKNLYSFDN
jgi:CMP-N,N'-diacetyllegionaminic acid synthase